MLHEYVGGFVDARFEARNSHNMIATDIIVEAGRQLRGYKFRAAGAIPVGYSHL